MNTNKGLGVEFSGWEHRGHLCPRWLGSEDSLQHVLYKNRG
jgi:hypothetical protein